MRKCVVRGAWCLVRGAWCVVRGAWCAVRGAWCASPAVTTSASCHRPSCRSALPWHREGKGQGPLGTDPTNGPFFNGFVGSVPTVCAPPWHWRGKGYQEDPLRNYRSVLSPCSHTVILAQLRDSSLTLLIVRGADAHHRNGHVQLARQRTQGGNGAGARTGGGMCAIH